MLGKPLGTPIPLHIGLTEIRSVDSIVQPGLSDGRIRLLSNHK
jgi:hypothetical protein